MNVCFINLGCKVNACETEEMMRAFEAAGHRVVPPEGRADAVILNTCTVTGVADKKTRQMLRRQRRLHPGAMIVAAGCFVDAPHNGDDLYDLAVGNSRKKDILFLVEEAWSSFVPAPYEASVEDRADADEDDSAPRRHTRGFLKIQDGCNQFCSYCLIPYVRGRSRSRGEDELAEEAGRLAACGYRELVLTGIHISSFGKEPLALVRLAERLSKIDGIRRIRLGSLEPGIITEEFAAGLRENSSVCPHFHLSLQSGCDSVLKRMNRRYTSSEYAEKCGILRRYYDDPALTTDVIVGFPGETDEEFAETKAFLSALKLYETHIFKYSRRAGTKAAELPGQLTEKVKAARSAQLLALNRKNQAAYRRRLAGRPCEVLLEEEMLRDGIQYICGYTREYVRLCLPAAGYSPGDIVKTVYPAQEKAGDGFSAETDGGPFMPEDGRPPVLA